MPNKVTQDDTVKAVNTALQELKPPGKAIENLGTDAMSDKNWSCYNFSPSVLEQICKITKTSDENLNTKEYCPGANLPASFANETFVNIAMTGEPSLLNHNFNILVSGGTTYLIQVFVKHSVKIVQSFENANFITHWHNLSNNINWVDSYFALFGVRPNQVVENPPISTWLTCQNVTQ